MQPIDLQILFLGSNLVKLTDGSQNALEKTYLKSLKVHSIFCMFFIKLYLLLKMIWTSLDYRLL